MNKIASIAGTQHVLSSEEGYIRSSYQYATSSYKDRLLTPGLIVVAKNLDDIKTTVKFARDNKVAIAIRSGGHQYSGASSTNPKNIQLDLSTTFKDYDMKTDSGADFKAFKEEGKNFVRASVSWRLGELIPFLKNKGLFVPTGQCYPVHVGGHAQTGGYGQFARSFGLFGDHVVAIELVDHNGEFRTLKKSVAGDRDLFSAILGGSPGNFGVLTHLTLQVHSDADYEGSFGLKAIHLYSAEKLKDFLDILTTMSTKDDIPGNFDLCVTALSKGIKLHEFGSGIDQLLGGRHGLVSDADEQGAQGHSFLLVYAQWIQLNKADQPPDYIVDWFKTFEKGTFTQVGGFGKLQKPSEMAQWWIFLGRREFEHPYVKRTFMSDSTLAKDKWPAWMANHIDEICDQNNGLFVSAQLQHYGGKNSKYRLNAGNGLSYSWRKDSTIGCAIDVFYSTDDPKYKDDADKWSKITDTMNGSGGTFSKQERRLLWGSFGDWNMDNVWQFYYDDKNAYEQIRKVRKAADPNGTFSPNPFCVPAAK